MQLIIVLERESVTPLVVRFALRASVPTARQPFVANDAFVSAYAATSQADLTALRAGKFVEVVRARNFSGMTLAEIRAELIVEQQALQARVTADGDENHWKYYGTTWDGSAWVTGGVN